MEQRKTFLMFAIPALIVLVAVALFIAFNTSDRGEKITEATRMCVQMKQQLAAMGNATKELGQGLGGLLDDRAGAETEKMFGAMGGMLNGMVNAVMTTDMIVAEVAKKSGLSVTDTAALDAIKANCEKKFAAGS